MQAFIWDIDTVIDKYSLMFVYAPGKASIKMEHAYDSIPNLLVYGTK